jgi:hypothetical protein
VEDSENNCPVDFGQEYIEKGKTFQDEFKISLDHLPRDDVVKILLMRCQSAI